MDPLTAISTRHTPQSQAAHPAQIPNAAGGYAFKLGEDARIHRFLTLGTTGGTYYTRERELTKANADVVLNVARKDGARLVEQIVAVSTAGRAPRQNPAIFALAAVAGVGTDAGRKAALAALPAVCRTGTHLFLFARYVEQFRGWGRGLRHAVGDWYLAREVNDIAYQAVKYRQREGWSHRDMLRLAHPKTADPARNALFKWITGGTPDAEGIPAVVEAFVRAQVATTVAEWRPLIENYPLSWEMLPDAALTEPDVWRAFVRKGMPQTALIRQLPRLTRLGVLDDRETLGTVGAQLTDPERLRRARVHPINLLIAQHTYAQGHGDKGSTQWEPKARIVDALDAAFYGAFPTVEPAGKRTLLALDVSASMAWQPISGLPLTPREASAALALVTAATEPDVMVVGFTTSLSELSISPRQRIDDAIRAVSDLPFGGTDCAQPMLWAGAHGFAFDTFQVYTDNETWAGGVHPHEALDLYREKMGIPARLVVVGMTANDVSIANPDDVGMLDVAGFDSATPSLIADFSRSDMVSPSP